MSLPEYVTRFFSPNTGRTRAQTREGTRVPVETVHSDASSAGMSRKGDSVTSAISCHSHSRRTASAVSWPDRQDIANLKSTVMKTKMPRIQTMMDEHLNRVSTEVLFISDEEEDHDDTDVNTSEVDSEGQFSDGSDDDHEDDCDRINELIAEIEEAKLKKLKAEKARLEAKKAASQSPRKKKLTPTWKKTRATSQRKVPIAKKRTLKGTTPKQVTIEEGNNTLNSPPQPPTTARILKPESAAAETQNNQPILQSVLEAIHPYFVKLQDSADKMSNAARRMEQEREEARLRMSAINMGQEQPHPSGPTLVDGTRPISANPTHHPASTAPAISPEEPLRPAFHQATIKSYQAAMRRKSMEFLLQV